MRWREAIRQRARPQGGTATWLSPLALSNTALFWATLIGGFSTLVLVPGTASIGLFSWQWLAVVAASQAAFAIVIIAVRLVAPAPGRGTVFFTLAISGAIRGLVIGLGAGLLGVSPMTVATLISRSLNSAVISVIGVALIGATLAWRADFRAQYRLLSDRALLLGSATATDADAVVIDPQVLDAWTSMKSDLDTTLKVASDRLAAGASPTNLNEAADLLTSAIDVRLRPAARAMWQDTESVEQPLRLRTLLIDTIARWQLPLREILGFLAVVVGIGSLVRSGVIDGGAYTLRYIIVTGLMLWCSTSLAKVLPRFAPAIALVTLVLLPPVILATDYWIGDVFLGLPEDPTGQIIVALQTPITTVFIAMAVAAVRDRQRVLDALQARIDAEAMILRNGHASRDAQRLSLFVHHSVQSELSALAMQVREAASTGDAETMNEVRLNALQRLEQLEALDAHSPPWLSTIGGRERITQVVDAWTGILDIEITLPDELTCRADQWQLAATVIEEGLANAARHGDAGHVTIAGRLVDAALLIELADDGAGVSRAPTVAAPTSTESITEGSGLGMRWLDRVTPGDWSLQQTPEGALLTVCIR